MSLVLPGAGPRSSPVQPGRPAQTALFAAYDIGLAVITIFVASDALNRFGVSSLVWLLVYALALGRIALAWPPFFALLMKNLPYFVYPAICGASVLWSYQQTSSLISAVQLTMTLIIAVVIGWRFSIKTICLMVFVMTSIAVALSLVNWLTGVFGEVWAGGGGLLGIFTQKNMLGRLTLVTAVSAVALLFMRFAPPPGPLIKMGAIAWLPAVVLAMMLSQSATAILMLPATVGLFFLLCVRELPHGGVVIVAAVACIIVALTPISLLLAGINPVEAVLAAFGKDATLTGRTDIWTLAFMVVGDHPMLGVGFDAFWEAGRFANLALLAQHAGGEGVAGFHNFALEILVATGVVGLFAMGLLIATTLYRGTVLWLMTRSAPSAYVVTMTISLVILSFVGSSLYRQHEFVIMFLVMLGVAARREIEAVNMHRRKMVAERNAAAARTT